MGGRNQWIAVPAGMLCIGVVGALTWLSLPALPAAAAWVGGAFYNATHLPQPTTAPGTAASFRTAESSGCRALYPDSLWTELTWAPKVLLTQNTAAPATSATTLTAALAPAVRVTCAWRSQLGTVSTTVAEVGGAAASTAQATLVAAGFACDTGAGLTCTRTAGDVVEEHIVRDGLWISSVETTWHPARYAARIAQRVWS